MEVMLAKYNGMCSGVITAMQQAEQAIREHQQSGKIYTLGPLVHNPHVVQYFEKKGVVVAESIDEIGSGTVIIRAHGVPDKVKEDARAKGLRVIDATCHLVLKLKKDAEELEQQGYFVAVYGKSDHPEIIGITGNLRAGNYAVVEGIEEARAIGTKERIGAVSQTTNMPEQYEKIQEELRRHCLYFEARNTICMATKQRQDSARQTAAGTDAMVIIGDTASSNTKNLAKACREVQPRTVLISDVHDLSRKNQDLRGASAVGVTAGASTPEWIIDEVVAALRGM